MRHPHRERRRIQQVRRRRPELGALLDFLDRIADAAPRLVPAEFDIHFLAASHDGPPLRPDRFPLDPGRAADAFRTLLDFFLETNPEAAGGKVKAALDEGLFDAAEACRALLRSDAGYFLRLEEAHGVSAALAAELTELAVKPQFIAAARALGAVPQEVADRCPLCGSWPEILLVVDRKDFERVAVGVCRLCESEWPVRRVRCPACGNEDPDRLSYLKVEGEEGVRVNVCGVCKTYVPMADTRGRLEVAPVVERAAAAHLDVAAERSGYQLLHARLVPPGLEVGGGPSGPGVGWGPGE